MHPLSESLQQQEHNWILFRRIFEINIILNYSDKPTYILLLFTIYYTFYKLLNFHCIL